MHTASTIRADQVSHKLLIGSPLIIVTLFCFGYMILQAYSTKHTVAASKRPSPIFANHLDGAMPPLHFAIAAEMTLADPSTVSPQNSSGSSQALQPAPQHDQSSPQPVEQQDKSDRPVYKLDQTVHSLL